MIPPALQRPGVRWDNIKPIAYDVRSAGQAFVRQTDGRYRPPETYEERMGPRTEVWWLVPRSTYPDPGEPRQPFAGKDD